MEQELLTLLSDPEAYKTKILELKTLLASCDKRERESKLKIDELAVVQFDTNKNIENLTKLQKIIEIEQNKVKSERKSIEDIQFQLNNQTEYNKAKEDFLNKKEEELSQQILEIDSKAQALEKANANVLALEAKFKDKLHQLSSIAND